jgi:hypothetical protein
LYINMPQVQEVKKGCKVIESIPTSFSFSI